ncbi:MAG TPA: dodecin domain-containing protein [Porticoccaceae bacterium]|nr:dodecin domain-containing protein [Porticoccaceae bacterium]
MLQGKSNELIGISRVSFEDALKEILAGANKTLRGIREIRVISKKVSIADDGALDYCVRAHLRFDMTGPDELHW